MSLDETNRPVIVRYDYPYPPTPQRLGNYLYISNKELDAFSVDVTFSFFASLAAKNIKEKSTYAFI